MLTTLWSLMVLSSSAAASNPVTQVMLEKSRQLQGPEAAGMIGSAIGSVLDVVLGPIYPILLLIFMTRPKVVAAFQVPPPLPPSAT